MPTVEFSLKDLQKLLRRKITAKELEDSIMFAKGEIESVNGDMVKADIKDSNRPDLWSIEGIAREMRGRYGDPGLAKYKIKKSGIKMIVDKKVENVRAKTVCAVVKNVRFDDYFIKQMIQLQEKIHQTYGRKREFCAAGIYDLDCIKPPIKYTTVKPNGIKFTPLDFEEEMTPAEILKKHPCGRDYGHLINKFEEYPLMIDSKGNVLSIPPIINSSLTGKISEKTKNVFIEITGHEIKRISIALNVIVTALAERGGQIQSVDIYYGKSKITRPDLTAKKFSLDTDYCRKILGLDLSDREIIKLLKQSRYDAKPGKNIVVSYPAYRDDIMHSRDIIEDVAISYGFNRMKPEQPRLATIGKINELEAFSEKLREVMIGLGFQEILTFSLTNKENLFEKMNIEEDRIIEIENPVSSSWTTLRNWLMPSIIEFATKNKHVDYPQKIFELADCVVIDESAETKTRDEKKLTCVITDNSVSYEEISSNLDAFLKTLGLKYELKRKEHGSFIHGRAAEIIVNGKHIGIVGEINPQVLENWRLEKPVVAFELNVNMIFDFLWK
ncbi:MAG: phenylalanine--tRNA ligase subunit beta [Candidatus Aenigmatarchaeota archaeon]